MNLYIFHERNQQKMIRMISFIWLFLIWNVHDVTAISSFVRIESNAVTIHMNEMISVPLSVVVDNTKLSNISVNIVSTDANIGKTAFELFKESDYPQTWNGTLNVTGVFLGISKVILEVTETGREKDTTEFLTVTVVRQERLIDTLFTASVAILVSVLYINFGCAIDWNVCKSTLKKPIGPAIGCFCQFIFMPLMSYFIGYFMFPNRPEMQIGMFFTGISPSGGASNIYTVLLGGNLNLSVTMTTICTIVAFGMMPFWIFTLGKHIFSKGQLMVPYSRIGMFTVGLIVPLAIGFFIQRKFPKLSKIMVRIMKPCSIILILFIVIFAIVTNLYLFKLFSFRIIIAGMGLPWAGFLFGLLVASLFRQPVPDVKAISIETGIQNTGVSIFLLRFALHPPADDLTTVVPVSAAIMTPIPLIILYIIKLIIDRRKLLSNGVTLSKQENFEGPPSVPKSTSSKPLINVLQ